MALMGCSECGKQVSDKASSCPDSSNPIKIKYHKNSGNFANIDDELLDLIKRGNKLKAIQFYKDKSGRDLASLVRF